MGQPTQKQIPDWAIPVDEQPPKGKTKIPDWATPVIEKKNLGKTIAPDLQTFSKTTPSVVETPSISEKEIPQVSLGGELKVENTTYDNMSEDDYNKSSVFDKIKMIDELKNQGTWVGGGNTGGGGGSFSMSADASLKANKIAKDIEDSKIDVDKLKDYTEGLNLNDEQKQKFDQLLKTNPSDAYRTLANNQWKLPVRDALKTKIDEANSNGDRQLANNLIDKLNFTYDYSKAGSYNDVRNNIRSLVPIIRDNTDNPDKLVGRLGEEASIAYGSELVHNPGAVQTDETKAAGLNDYQVAALNYFQDLNPSKYEAYRGVLLKSNDPTLSMTPEEKTKFLLLNKGVHNDSYTKTKVGEQTKLKQLEETGISLKYDALNEMYADALSRNDVEKANSIKQQIDGLKEESRNIDLKYPLLKELNSKLATDEVLGNDSNPIARFFNKVNESVSNTVEGVGNIGSSLNPFENDQEKYQRLSKVLGNKKMQEVETNLPQSSQLMQSKELVYDDKDFGKAVEDIKNSKLSDSDKRIKTEKLFADNVDKWHFKGIDPKSNLSVKSLLFAFTDFGAEIAPYVLVSSMVGGGASSGAFQKFVGEFAGGMTTMYNDELSNAVERGDPNPQMSAWRSTTINALSLAGAGTASEIRALASKSKNPLVRNMISNLDDETILKALRYDKQEASGLRKIVNVAKNLGSNTIESGKSALKVTAATTAGQKLNQYIDNGEVDLSDVPKELLVGTLKFTLFGSALGLGKAFKEPNDIQKLSIYEAGKNPDEFIRSLDSKYADGNLTKEEYIGLKKNIETAKKVYENTPQLDGNGNKLSDADARELMFLKYQEADIEKTMGSHISKDLNKKLEERLKRVQDNIDKVYKGTYIPNVLLDEKTKSKDEHGNTDTYLINGENVSKEDFQKSVANKTAAQYEYNGEDENTKQSLIDLGGNYEKGTTELSFGEKGHEIAPIEKTNTGTGTIPNQKQQSGKDVQLSEKDLQDNGVSFIQGASHLAKENSISNEAAELQHTDAGNEIMAIVNDGLSKGKSGNEIVGDVDKIFNEKLRSIPSNTRNVIEQLIKQKASDLPSILKEAEAIDAEIKSLREEDGSINNKEDIQKFKELRTKKQKLLEDAGVNNNEHLKKVISQQSGKDVVVDEGVGKDALKDVESTAKALDKLANDNPDIHSKLEEQAGVMYHGTEADFDKFDRVGEKIPSLGLGYYFTPTLEKAKQYGSKIKKIVLEGAKILNWNKLSDTEREQIKKRLEERMPKSVLGGLGKRNERTFNVKEQRQESLDFFHQKQEETANYEYERGKARVKRDGDNVIISWSEEGLNGVNDAELLNFTQRYDNNIGIEMGYDAAKYGNEIAVFNGEKIKNATNEVISEAYHKAKKDGSNPELVKAVEQSLSTQKSKPLDEGVVDKTEPNQKINETQDQVTQDTNQANTETITLDNNGNEVPPINKVEEVGNNGNDGNWEAIRKAKQVEIDKVKEAYEKQPVKTWSETMNNGLTKASKMFPEKNLYDATTSLMRQMKLGGGTGDLTPDEAVAAMHYLKMETNSKRSALADRVLESDDSIVRDVAALEDSLLKEQYDDAALEAKKITTQAGRTLNYAQAEIMNSPENGLKIRRMELTKAKGSPLTETENAWAKEQFDKQLELQKRENEVMAQKMQDTFDEKIAELKKEHEAALKNQNPTTPKARQKKSEKLKDLAKRIRTENELDKFNQSANGGIVKSSMFGDVDFKELAAQAVEYIAKAVEAGEDISKAILESAKKFKGKFDESEFGKNIAFLITKAELPTKEEATNKIREYIKKSGDTDVTNEMVGKNLIRDYINSHIGDVEQNDLLNKAFNDLKKELPNLTKEKLIEAYLKENEFKQTTKKQLEGGINESKNNLKKLAKKELTADQEQKIMLSNEIKKESNKIKEYQRRIDNNEFDENTEPPKLNKKTSELITIQKERTQIEDEFRAKQKEFKEKNKTQLAKVPELLRAAYVNYLISAFHTLGKVGEMALMRPATESLRRGTNSLIINNLFPNLSEAALSGGEGSKWLKQAWGAFARQYSSEQLNDIYEKNNTRYEEAAKKYMEYRDSKNPNKSILQKLKNDVDDKLIKVQGSLMYKFIGGSSFADALDAFVHRSNEIEKQFGHGTQENFNALEWKNSGGDSFMGMNMDNAKYVISFIGRSHSALKTFSGRFSFALGYMSRLEGAVKSGVDITNPNRILEIAHESYLDWNRGKYQQDNMILNAMKNMLSNPTNSKFKEAINWLVRMNIPVARIPLNLLHEKLVEYGLGIIKAAYMANREIGWMPKLIMGKTNEQGQKLIGNSGSDGKKIPILQQMKEEGYSKISKQKEGFTYANATDAEFKKEFAQRVRSLDGKQAATIARCLSKGLTAAGVSASIYLLHLFMGLNYGGFPHKGQRKSKDEKLLKEDELNPGQVEINGNKLPKWASDLITHNQVLYQAEMGLSMANAYNDEVKNKGNDGISAIEKALWDHVKIVEGEIPQTKMFGSPTGVVEDIAKKFKGKLQNDDSEVGKFLTDMGTSITPYNSNIIKINDARGKKIEFTKGTNPEAYNKFIAERDRLIKQAVKDVINNGFDGVNSDEITPEDYSSQYGIHKKIESEATKLAKINVLGAYGIKTDKINLKYLNIADEPIIESSDEK